MFMLIFWSLGTPKHFRFRNIVRLNHHKKSPQTENNQSKFAFLASKFEF